MMVDCSGIKLDLTTPKIMGILNVTPDSFSDGGKFFSVENALQQAQQMIQEGADIIDIGGESTRPGAAEVSLSEEIDRVIPIIEALSHLSVPISIDTSKPEVMEAAVNAGASLINDVCGLATAEARDCAAGLQVPVCLMHMQGQPRTMQSSPEYADVVAEVSDFLLKRAELAELAGVKREHIILDPGFGFGKTLEHNLQLMNSISKLVSLGYPILIGASRKSFLGSIIDRKTDNRVSVSVAAAQYAAQQGANIVRVHDVAETRDMLEFLKAVNQQ